MISDYFPPRKRGVALALWGLSSPFGAMLGFAAGGYITAALSWRQAFLVFGVIGVALAPVVLLMREPRRGVHDPAQLLGAEGPLPLREVLATLWSRRAFRFLAIGGAAHAFVQFLTINWNAPFFARVHHMPIREVATYLALAVGLCGGLG
jgi:MFS family permease